jgi:hypothetical protein
MQWQGAPTEGNILDLRKSLIQKVLGLPGPVDVEHQAAVAAHQQALRYKNWQQLQLHPEWLNLPAAGTERRANEVLEHLNPPQQTPQLPNLAQAAQMLGLAQ